MKSKLVILALLLCSGQAKAMEHTKEWREPEPPKKGAYWIKNSTEIKHGQPNHSHVETKFIPEVPSDLPSSEVKYSTLPAHYYEIWQDTPPYWIPAKGGGAAFVTQERIEVPYKIEGWHCVEFNLKDVEEEKYREISLVGCIGCRPPRCIREEGYREDGVVVWRKVKQ